MKYSLRDFIPVKQKEVSQDKWDKQGKCSWFSLTLNNEH